jgi:hypothetical protein
MTDGCPTDSGATMMTCSPEREFGYLFRDGDVDHRGLPHTISISKDNEAYFFTYVEEDDDVANKVGRRKRIGVTY